MFVPSSITFRPWDRHTADGHHPFSAYFETFWLPVVGPTAAWSHRRLTALLEQHPDGVAHDTADLAAQMGVRPAALMHTLDRLEHFQLARWIGHSRTRLAVRAEVPPLSEHQLARLSESLRAAHAQVAVRQVVPV